MNAEAQAASETHSPEVHAIHCPAHDTCLQHCPVQCQMPYIWSHYAPLPLFFPGVVHAWHDPQSSRLPLYRHTSVPVCWPPHACLPQAGAALLEVATLRARLAQREEAAGKLAEAPTHSHVGGTQPTWLCMLCNAPSQSKSWLLAVPTCLLTLPCTICTLEFAPRPQHPFHRTHACGRSGLRGRQPSRLDRMHRAG